MSVPATPTCPVNPVTPDEVAAAVLAADAADAGRSPVSDPDVKRLLHAVPNGPIPADHPAALTLARALCRRLKPDTPQVASAQLQTLLHAIHPWPGHWEPIVAQAVRERYFAVFRDRHDDSRPNAKIPPLVNGLLLDRQPCLFGGRAKAMKTTMAADCAAALLTGTPYLGQAVAGRFPVLYLTGERSAHAVRHLIHTSAARREPDRTVWAELVVTARMHLVTTEDGRKALMEYVGMGGGRVVFFDPLYLMLGDVNTTDLSAMGAKLRWLCEPVLRGGGTPVLIHHGVKGSAVGEFPALDDLSGAGVAEFARSWLLLSRAGEYTGGNTHDLLALTGTCEGHHARRKVRLHEVAMEVTATDADTPAPTPIHSNRRPR